jgi:hypothetical protein
LVHSRGTIGLLFCGDVLYRHGDRGLIVDLGQREWPRAIHVEMLFPYG